MTFNPNTSSVAEASISEKELFSEFAEYGFNYFDPFTGESSGAQLPLEWLSSQAGYTDVAEALELWAYSLHDSKEPLEVMSWMLESLGVFLQDLRETRNHYERLQSLRAVRHGADGDEDCDDEPRYIPRPTNWPGTDEGVGSNMTGELI